MENSTDNERSKRESQHLLSIPGVKEKLIEGSKTPIEECEDVDDINWEEIEMEVDNQDNQT
jgi:hypothetical protein